MSRRRLVVKWRAVIASLLLAGWMAGCGTGSRPMATSLESYVLDDSTPTDAALQAWLEDVDTRLRARWGMTSAHTAAGLLDLRGLRLAMIRPDRGEYAASLPKVAILLAWFQLRTDATASLSPATRRELGLMIKQSSNELAAKYSQELGLAAIRQVLDLYGLYDARHGGGLWLGKHYGQGGERLGDPVGDHSHAATVRQMLRFYLLLEQGRLVSPAASRTMREIFASPDLPHHEDRFVRALAGRGVQLLRKSGSWEDWRHDSAVITGPGRHYVLVALTHHPAGDAYLEELARAVDDLLQPPPAAARR
jgi:beta-lactamase class A